MDHDKKEFGGKLSPEDLSRVKNGLDDISEKSDELSEIVIEDSSLAEEILGNAPGWSHWYQHTHIQLNAFFLVLTGLDKHILDLTKGGDIQEAALEFIENPTDDFFDEESLTIEEKGIFASLVFANHGNIKALSMYNISMYDLLQRGKEDDESLFKAVMVDRAVLSSHVVTQRIQIASIQHDENFFGQLSKAIKGSRPRRPAEELDQFRYILELVAEVEKLSSIGYERLYTLFVEDLELYPEQNKKDAFEGIKKLIQRRNKVVGT